MLEKLKEWRGGILLFLSLVLMFNIYLDRINELNAIEDQTKIAYYENN